MTLADLVQAVKQWDLSNTDDRVDAAGRFDSATGRFENILSRLKWFGQNEWNRYIPAENGDRSTQYMVRLAEWIGNVETDEERKLLLEYALHVAFFSHEDLCALYRTAFSGVITRWVIEQEKLTFEDTDFQTRLAEELHQRTWYCPITDSMDINEFYHANHIIGVTHRPGFALLKMLDEPIDQDHNLMPTRLMKNLKKYIGDPNPRSGALPLKRIVLLEDFVGTGTQSSAALKWAVENLELPILCVPLVICAPGVKKLVDIAEFHAKKVRIYPLLKLDERDLLGNTSADVLGIPNAKQIENLARSTFSQVLGDQHLNENIAPHTAFGFKETGASFVSYSNTPNNTMPLVHHQPKSGGWRPLFPRSARV
jgi:hypothetical protein